MTAIYHVTPQIIDDQAPVSVLRHSDPDRLKNPDSLRELPYTFMGRGETRGFLFTLLRRSVMGYLYQVRQPGGLIHFEVFRPEPNFRFGCMTYPGSASFGKTAWTYRTLGEAETKFETLNNQ